jgi:hypothetical protein
MLPNHTNIPDCFERVAVFTRGREFVRWLPDGMSAHDARMVELAGPLEPGQHAALYRCQRIGLLTPVPPEAPVAEMETTRGVFGVQWMARHVRVIAPGGVADALFEVSSLEDAWMKIRLGAARLAERHCVPLSPSASPSQPLPLGERPTRSDAAGEGFPSLPSPTDHCSPITDHSPSPEPSPCA